MHSSIVTYCKAQAEIDRIDTSAADLHKSLKARIRVCKSLVHEEMVRANCSCLEVREAGSADIVYFRLKDKAAASSMTIKRVLATLEQARAAVALEEGGGEQVSDAIVSAFCDASAPKDSRPTLHTCKHKKRHTDVVQPDGTILKAAQDMLAAQSELRQSNKETKTQKMASLDVQKDVEPDVKRALQNIDPEHLTSRINLVHGTEKVVHYLRCTEQSKTKPLAVRQILPVLRESIAEALRGTQRLDDAFWKQVVDEVQQKLEEMSTSTTTSKISLDRGTRKRKSNEA